MENNIDDKIFASSSWIGSPFATPNAPVFTRSFDITKPVASAFLRVSGLGLFEAYVNGTDVDAGAFFEPGESDARRTVYYRVYDISHRLHAGKNTVAVLLGNGQYANYRIHRQPGRYYKTDDARSADEVDGMFGSVKLLAEITVTYSDGEKAVIGTDSKWRCAESPITENCWYGGEDYDARLEAALFDPDQRWKPARICAPERVPRGTLTERVCPSIRIQDADTITSDKIFVTEIAKHEDANVYIVDMGRNGAMIPQLTVNTHTPGLTVRMYPAEIDSFDGIDGHINQESCTQSASAHGDLIYDTYTTKGAGVEVWHPRFCYHGCRYIEVDAPPELTITNECFTGFILRTDNEKLGSFSCSDDTLCAINTLIERSIESNMFSTFTDCPQIEKLGWLETPGLMFGSMAHTYNIDAWSRKLTRDMIDAQRGDGWIPAIAPEYFRIGGLCEDVNWNGSLIFTAWQHYSEYGDPDVLSDAYYEPMKRYMRYLASIDDGGIIRSGHMGEWGEMTKYGKTPTALVETTAYYRLAVTMENIARVRGDVSDAEQYRALAEKIESAFYRDSECFSSEHLFGSGTQSSYGLSLFSGIVRHEYTDEAVRRLVDTIAKTDYHLTSGEVGLRSVFSSLSEHGYSDVVYKMVTNDTMPSYKYFLLRGQTTLPEYWNFEEPWYGMARSRNHAMMGHVKEWSTKYLAGIVNTSPGYRTVDIKPSLIDALTSVDGRVTTVRGPISSSWTHDADSRTFTLTLSLPDTVAASVYLPNIGVAAAVSADGAPSDAAVTDGGRYLHLHGTFTCGTHTFTVKYM